ncbi:hypothetical protein QQF64_015285 [Cirrhinus molitorella]|uniref:C1q domain-containing protein n=1 Tax=Cirrhinus molitorella TaxID=172907 RepID=A0ABR3NUV0_9TELE
MQSMEEEMERLRTENTALTTKLKTFEEKTEVSERVKVAFSASLSTLKDGFQFIGPYTQTTTLVYKNAITNIGNAYNNNSGIFTAPVKGVYFFNFVVFNPHDISTGVKLLKNGNVVVTATDNPPKQDTEDTTFNSVSLILEQDDLFSPSINILEELGRMKIMETRMETMEKEMEQIRTENTAQAKKLEETKIKMDEVIKENLAQAKELETMRGTTVDVKIKMDDLIKQNEVSKVAFSVSLSSSNGPHSSSHTLIYKHIFLNTGEAYDANTGIFTAPMKGVYVFRVFSKAYGSRDKAVVAGLFKNGQHEISTYARQDGGFIGSSNGVSLLLEKGDKELLPQPTHPCGAQRGYNWADFWGPSGLPNWDPANFVRSFHGGPKCVSPDGLMMGS